MLKMNFNVYLRNSMLETIDGEQLKSIVVSTGLNPYLVLDHHAFE
jgi:hypothetical protein